MVSTKIPSLILIGISILLLSVSVNGQLRGHVVLKQTNGNTVPVPYAILDLWRTDKAEERHAKTDSDGRFKLNLSHKGNYILAVSAQKRRTKILGKRRSRTGR